MDVNSFVIGYTKGKQSASGGGGEGGIAGFHKVQFFNDDQTTLLYTVFVPHGSSAMYAGETPTSTIDSTMVLAGFEPSPENVTEDMDCYAFYEDAFSLNLVSWAEIAELSANEEAQNYFAVGDTKMIHIEGTVGTTEVNGDFGVYIIGFDHNESYEGKGIHFGTFKSARSNGIDICLADNYQNLTSDDGTKRFNMNHGSNSNKYGWKGCAMRYDILGSVDVAGAQNAGETTATTPVADTLMAALPADLRAVMKPMTKYTDNEGDSGNSNNSLPEVTDTTDYLPLLAEYEVFGNRKIANNYEKNKQKQYSYYVAGNSKIKKKHSNPDTSFAWHLRSPANASSTAFCNGAWNGEVSQATSACVYGLAPIFKV